MNTKFSTFYFVFSLLIIIFTIQEVSSIKCWYCNSLLDPYCSDPFDNSTANPRDCSIEVAPPHLKGVPADMCRKIRMKVNGQWRFKRDCARLGEPGVGGDERYCIYRTGTYNIHMEYCTCDDKDGCNSVSRLNVSYLLVIGMPFVVFSFIRNFPSSSYFSLHTHSLI